MASLKNRVAPPASTLTAAAMTKQNSLDAQQSANPISDSGPAPLAPAPLEASGSSGASNKISEKVLEDVLKALEKKGLLDKGLQNISDQELISALGMATNLQNSLKAEQLKTLVPAVRKALVPIDIAIQHAKLTGVIDWNSPGAANIALERKEDKALAAEAEKQEERLSEIRSENTYVPIAKPKAYAPTGGGHYGLYAAAAEEAELQREIAEINFNLVTILSFNFINALAAT